MFSKPQRRSGGGRARLSTGRRLGSDPTSSSMMLERVRAKIMVMGRKLRNLTRRGCRDLFCVRTKGRTRGTQVTRVDTRIINRILVFIINHHPHKTAQERCQKYRNIGRHQYRQTDIGQTHRQQNQADFFQRNGSGHSLQLT